MFSQEKKPGRPPFYLNGTASIVSEKDSGANLCNLAQVNLAFLRHLPSKNGGDVQNHRGSGLVRSMV